MAGLGPAIHVFCLASTPSPLPTRPLQARPLPQLELLYLPRRSLRQRPKGDEPRALVMRHMRAAPRNNVRLSHALRPRLQRHESLRRLAPLRVRPRHHRRLHHIWMLVEHLLDLQRRDVLPTGNDDVLRPILDLDITIRMYHREVAGMEPSPGKSLVAG